MTPDQTERSGSVLFVVKGQGMDLAFAYKGPDRSCLCLVPGLCLVTLASNLQANPAKRDASARLWLVWFVSRECYVTGRSHKWHLALQICRKKRYATE